MHDGQLARVAHAQIARRAIPPHVPSCMKRMKQKRVALEIVAAELRRIIGEPITRHAETDMRLAA
jgi:hypothetical protein